MKRKLILLAAVAFMLSFGGAHASGYIGASVGATSPDDSDFDDSDGFRITLGYGLNEHFAVEAAYQDLGEFDLDDDLVDALGFVTGFDLDGVSLEVEGFELGVMGRYPVTEAFSIFGRAGIFFWDVEFTIDSTSLGSESESEDGSDVYFGFGAAYDLSQSVALNVEYMMYDSDEVDIDYLGAGVIFKF